MPSHLLERVNFQPREQPTAAASHFHHLQLPLASNTVLSGDRASYADTVKLPVCSDILFLFLGTRPPASLSHPKTSALICGLLQHYYPAQPWHAPSPRTPSLLILGPAAPSPAHDCQEAHCSCVSSNQICVRATEVKAGTDVDFSTEPRSRHT